ncbi:MAG: hypothetical protein JWQ57_4137 [Mucilaginibacter sp.]|nr:hypothetical protein [Mucilaginibacter sp.]
MLNLFQHLNAKQCAMQALYLSNEMPKQVRHEVHS